MLLSSNCFLLRVAHLKCHCPLEGTPLWVCYFYLWLFLIICFIEGLTVIFTSAWWVALESILMRLSTVSRHLSSCRSYLTEPLLHYCCPSCRGLNRVAPQCTWMSLLHCSVITHGTSIPQMHCGLGWCQVPGWTHW
jgi:hypothetical protein